MSRFLSKYLFFKRNNTFITNSARILNVDFPEKRNKSKNIKYFSSESRDCSKCFSRGGLDVFCSKCGAVQRPPPSMNYFEILGIAKTFNVQDLSLTKRYKELQKLLHPDKFSNKDDKEKSISDEYSSLVNKAYSTLLDPLKRGLYMLKLKNITISEETQMQSDFLMEIMERNEAVAEADTPDKILKIDEENKSILSDLIRDLSLAFEKDDDTEVLKLVIRLKYFTSIDNQIKDMIRKMGIIK